MDEKDEMIERLCQNDGIAEQLKEAQSTITKLEGLNQRKSQELEETKIKKDSEINKL